MSWWEYSYAPPPVPTNPRNNYYDIRNPRAPWQTPGYPGRRDVQEDRDSDSSDDDEYDEYEPYRCRGCGRRRCRCRRSRSRSRRRRSSEFDTPYVPRVRLPRSRSRSHLPVHNPGVTGKKTSTFTHQLTRRSRSQQFVLSEHICSPQAEW